MSLSVSIIVPCYNQGQYLAECLESVAVQNSLDWECIIVNDGSNDNSEEIATQYCQKNSRFKYIFQINRGLSAARNNGIRISAGKYILPLDADDKISADYVNEAVAVLNKFPDVKIVYAAAEYFGSKTGLIELPNFSLEKLASQNLIYCSAFFRKTDFEQYGGYDEQFLHGWEDWDFWLGLLENGGAVVKLPGIHFFYRQKKSSMLTEINGDNDIQTETRTMIFTKHFHLYTRLFGDPILMLREKERVAAQLMTIRKNIFFKTMRRLGLFGKI